MNILTLLYLIVSLFGYPVNSIVLCNGVNIDNVDRVLSIGDYRLIHFSFDDNATFVIVYDDCSEYSAIEISTEGIEKTEF